MNSLDHTEEYQHGTLIHGGQNGPTSSLPLFNLGSSRNGVKVRFAYDNPSSDSLPTFFLGFAFGHVLTGLRRFIYESETMPNYFTVKKSGLNSPNNRRRCLRAAAESHATKCEQNNQVGREMGLRARPGFVMRT